MKTIRWGILGAGKIARKFAADLAFVQNASLVAVGAREKQSADVFAKEFSIPNVHGSYESLAQDPEVDVIYVATPHGFHYEHVLLCLGHKKAVLCEKAFAINSTQAKEMIDFASLQNTFIMEAFWTKFLPHYNLVKKIIADGKVGTIQNIIAEFGFKPTPPIAQRIHDPLLGGGSLLDIGLYPVFLTLDILGRPDQIEAIMTPAYTGVDDQIAIQFKYNDGKLAQLFSSFTSNMATGADINGDAGRIRLTHRFHGPTTNVEFYPTTVDTKQEVALETVKGNGYEYEAQHVTDCLLAGLTESPVMKHADTLLLMETLDRIREKAGIVYPHDKRVN
jgi:predicted dehydrogenase